MREEVPTQNVKVIDSKVLNRCDTTSEPKPGTAQPYIVYLNKDEVEKAEALDKRRMITKLLLFAIGLLSLFMCFLTVKLYYHLQKPVAPPSK